MKLMLDCQALARLLSQSQDGVPPLTTRARMRLHLVSCQACRNLDEQMRFIGKAMQALETSLPSDLPVAKPPR